MNLKSFDDSIPMTLTNAPFLPIEVAYREGHFDLYRGISINPAASLYSCVFFSDTSFPNNIL